MLYFFDGYAQYIKKMNGESHSIADISLSEEQKELVKIDYDNIVKAGFKDVSLTLIDGVDYYKTKEDLLALLLKTPILDDFSERKIRLSVQLCENSENMALRRVIAFPSL